MQKKPTKIVNPMTIIAIFAALSETSAAVSLPFLDDDDRELYIWFLISFPFYLMFLFFITLNFNYKSLYAPSDFQKGKHFIKVFDEGARPEKKPVSPPPPVECDDLPRPSIPREIAAQPHKRKNHGEIKGHPDYLLQSAQDPPAHVELISRLRTPQQICLPASVHCIRIVDARWVRKKKDTGRLTKTINQAPLTQQTFTMLLTCAESEQLIGETLKKSAIKAMHANDSCCIFYNLNTQAINAVASPTTESQAVHAEAGERKDRSDD
jgi:hypothetical protein